MHHQLQELRVLHRRHVVHEPVVARALQLYKCVQKAPWWAWHEDPPLVPLGAGVHHDSIAALLDWCDTNWLPLYDRVTLASAHSLRQWRLSICDSLVTGKVKQLGSWLKGRQRLPLLVTDDAMISHPQKIGEELRRAWLPVYSPDINEVMSDQMVAYMTELIDPVRWCPGAICPQALQAFATSRTSSAPGMDCIHLAVLHDRAWAYLTMILNLVESTGRWPRSLLEVSLCAIPKGEANTAKPLKYRLIGITSHVYRVWSGLRAMQANNFWISHLIGDCSYGGIPKRSAKQASFADALTWEETHHSGSAYFAAYVDASKCFDNLRYSDLIRVSRALGLSERILAPLEYWYQHHERHIVVGGWKQPAFRPQRGIPQGCPLSVTMAIVWSVTWSSRAVQMLAAEHPAHWSCATYLDDYSFGSSSIDRLQRCLGWTQMHFKEWGICLNLDKSSLVTNRSDEKEIQGMHLLSADEYCLMGINTGWVVGNAKLEERLQKAKQLTERACLLNLPQGHFQQLASIFLQPQLYGLEFNAIVPALEQYDRSLRIPLWGKARVSGNWHAILAIDIPSHTCTAMGSRYQRSFATIWTSSTIPSLRTRLLRLWNSQVVPRASGGWAAFVSLLAESSMRLSMGGGIQLALNEDKILHLNMPKSVWQHQARLCWRMMHMGRAARMLPQIYPAMVHLLDWTLTLRPNGRRTAMLGTFQCNAINSASRCHRHFAVACSPLCEHACGEPDDGEHRLTRCEALALARGNLGISEDDLTYLQSLHACHRRAAIWLFPLDYLPWRLPLEQSWRLWPHQEWLQQVNGAVLPTSGIVLTVTYIMNLQGVIQSFGGMP